MDHKRVWRRVRQVWIATGLLVTGVFVAWSLVAYRPSAIALAATTSDTVVSVERTDGVWFFRPVPAPSSDVPALIFFPGSLVDPRAYAPLLHAVASAGYPAYLIELPRRGAFGGADDPELAQRIDRVVTGAGAPGAWIASGHSRGAVVASAVASDQRPGFAGLVVIGSSHPRDVDLSALRVAVTKIVGTRDGLASPEEVESNRDKLPSQTRWVWIDGGNHSQFGWYGFQPGDGRPTIDATRQRNLMIQAVIDVLQQVAAACCSTP